MSKVESNKPAPPMAAVSVTPMTEDNTDVAAIQKRTYLLVMHKIRLSQLGNNGK